MSDAPCCSRSTLRAPQTRGRSRLPLADTTRRRVEASCSPPWWGKSSSVAEGTHRSIDGVHFALDDVEPVEDLLQQHDDRRVTVAHDARLSVVVTTCLANQVSRSLTRYRMVL